MKHPDDPADLLSEARRRNLTRDEESRLEGLLDEAPEERMLFRAGLSFDRDSSAREGDDLLVARLASRAAQRFRKPTPSVRRRRRPILALLVAALVAAGTAAAGTSVVYLVRTDPPGDPPSSGVRVAAASPAQKAKPREARPRATVAEPALTVAIDTVAAGEAATPVRGIGSNRVSSAIAASPKRDPAALGASALFGEANKKRLAGDTAGAVERYLLVAERYPGSSEANLADLSLGKLFIASGDSKRALTHFRRAGASGALGAEALWGEASALRTLARTSDEHAALERLLAQYPNGAYAKAARKRLGTDAP